MRCSSTGYPGAYLAVLGHTDVVSFTAGIGGTMRRAIFRARYRTLTKTATWARGTHMPGGFRSDDSPIAVLVVPNE